MSGAGTGQPNWFKCAKCKLKRNRLGHALAGLPVLTGRERPAKTGHGRMGKIAREYRCRNCGHVGWSRHLGLVNYGAP